MAPNVAMTGMIAARMTTGESRRRAATATLPLPNPRASARARIQGAPAMTVAKAATAVMRHNQVCNVQCVVLRS